MPPRNTWVAGADGFRHGWVVALRHLETGETRCRTVSGAEALLALEETPIVIGVDMVIGLPEVVERGGRACDRAARARLGWPRSSSVFSPPARAALAETDYDAAQAANRAHSTDAIGLSRFSFNLFPKIRALDAALTPERQERLREVHPELCFWMMNEQEALGSKHEAGGRAARTALLEAHGFAGIRAAVDAHCGGGVTPDDVLDAHAACWTAARIAAGTAEHLPGPDPPTDARGLRMELWI